MTVEVLPLGVTCNLSCGYCYEHPIRDAGNFEKEYDMGKMKTALSKHSTNFSIFGGEPLLVSIKDLEELWRWGYERTKYNSIQTNGTLITDEHIELFKKYNVHVGMSMDGPDEMNDSRWAGSLEKTRLMTQRSNDNLKKCIEQGIGGSLIVTLHKGNASTKQKLDKLKQWFSMYDKIGLKSARIHLLEVDNNKLYDNNYVLTEQETINAMLDLSEFEKELKNFKFDMFGDMRKLLNADDQRTTCVWNACDPYTTKSVQGVNSQGETSNCGRVNKDGVDHIKSDSEGWERQLALYETPYENGGCKDCRFFIMCKGECPGTAIDMDWRNRTRDCKVWMTLFEKFENEMVNEGKLPLSIHPKLKELEQMMLDNWRNGINVPIYMVMNSMLKKNPNNSHLLKLNSKGLSHGDHTDHSNTAKSEHTNVVKPNTELLGIAPIK